MTVLIFWVYFVAMPTSPPALPTTSFMVPPSLVAAEFSSLSACEAAAIKTLADIRSRSPLFVSAGYTCNKKA